MAEKSTLNHVERMLRRLSDQELDLIGSLISKKLRNREVDEIADEEEVNIINFESLYTNLRNYNPTVINVDPNKQNLDILKGVIEASGLLEGKPKYFVAIVSPRFKYEGGETAVKNWLMKVGIPQEYVDKIFYTSCMPESSKSTLLVV